VARYIHLKAMSRVSVDSAGHVIGNTLKSIATSPMTMTRFDPNVSRRLHELSRMPSSAPAAAAADGLSSPAARGVNGDRQKEQDRDDD